MYSGGWRWVKYIVGLPVGFRRSVEFIAFQTTKAHKRGLYGHGLGARIVLARVFRCCHGAVLQNNDHQISPFRLRYHVGVVWLQLQQ